MRSRGVRANVRRRAWSVFPSAALVAVMTTGTARADFNYNDFSSTAGLTLVGVAAQTGSTILITPATNAVAGLLGSAAQAAGLPAH